MLSVPQEWRRAVSWHQRHRLMFVAGTAGSVATFFLSEDDEA